MDVVSIIGCLNNMSRLVPYVLYPGHTVNPPSHDVLLESNASHLIAGDNNLVTSGPSSASNMASDEDLTIHPPPSKPSRREIEPQDTFKPRKERILHLSQHQAMAKCIAASYTMPSNPMSRLYGFGLTFFKSGRPFCK